jgi:hypothetical protein
MKKVKTIVFYWVCLGLTGCGSNNLENDAKRLADIQCRAQKLMTKASANALDTSVLSEAQKLKVESEALLDELNKKYSSEADKKKMAEILLKELQSCK